MLPSTAADVFRKLTDPQQMHTTHEVYDNEDSDTDDSSSHSDDSSVNSEEPKRKGHKEKPPTTAVNIIMHNKKTDQEETFHSTVDQMHV